MVVVTGLEGAEAPFLAPHLITLLVLDLMLRLSTIRCDLRSHHWFESYYPGGSPSEVRHRRTKDGGRYWTRTSGLSDVNRTL